MVEEGSGVIIPQSEWDKGAGCFRLTLVGRLLSHRSVHFDALKDSLTTILQPAKGVVVRKEHFVDPSSQTPYGAWLRASGPVRRIGSGSIPARPTYIWRGSSSLGLSGSGAVGGGSGAVGGSAREGTSSLGWRLLDEKSDSAGPAFQDQTDLGPVRNVGHQALLRHANSSSGDSVGSSLGPMEVLPELVVGQFVRPKFVYSGVEKLTESPLNSLEPFKGELDLGISDNSGLSLAWRLSSPINVVSVPVGDEAVFLMSLVDVPLASSFSIAGEGGFSVARGSKAWVPAMRARGQRGSGGRRGREGGRGCGGWAGVKRRRPSSDCSGSG
ncbi:hypothetical protein Salat_0861800 [Sesamum alatum]|uniref:Uncharacterized protein n=1 Tax=Sesamum alatum TaxID=300844 RepID=A0AAE2CQQ1_9LAMI|nr:hypothetical protein Salat_0861800 [Sesamum alatum]